ncbi:MAG TPA: hypothetical protein VIV60_37285, partial [Polyangiaceae bacterium]
AAPPARGGSSSGGNPSSSPATGLGGTSAGGSGSGSSTESRGGNSNDANSTGGSSSSSAMGDGGMNMGGSSGRGGASIGTNTSNASGGSFAIGGAVSFGGTSSADSRFNGGSAGVGSSSSTRPIGGNTAAGAASSGGSRPIGGSTATGGAATGGAATTTAPIATSCTFPSSWAPTSPTYTTYTLPNASTACGYKGTNNNIKNIANATYFAAIPDSSTNFVKGDRCGACVQIGNAIITIVDECPTTGGQNQPCANNLGGHLDLSQSAASSAGVQGNPDLKNQAAWKFVPCPITGNVIVRLKQGNDNEIFIENEIMPIAAVTCGSQTGSRTSYGAWHFSNNVKGESCSVKDAANRTITLVVGNTQDQDVDSGTQFPKCN